MPSAKAAQHPRAAKKPKKAAAAAKKKPTAAKTKAAAAKPAATAAETKPWVGKVECPLTKAKNERETKRCCAKITKLRVYLRTAGAGCQSLEFANSSAKGGGPLWAAINKWARHTYDGIAHMNSCKSLQQANKKSCNFDVDHVIPQGNNGSSCIFNAYFMDSDHNREFGEAAFGRPGGAKGNWKKKSAGGNQAKYAEAVGKIGKSGSEEQWSMLEANMK